MVVDLGSRERENKEVKCREKGWLAPTHESWKPPCSPGQDGHQLSADLNRDQLWPNYWPLKPALFLSFSSSLMLYRERVKEGRKKELLIIYFLCVCHSARVMAGWHPSRSVRVACNPFCSPDRTALCVWGKGGLKQHEIKHYRALGQRDFVAGLLWRERKWAADNLWKEERCRKYSLFSTQAGGGTTNGFVTLLLGEALCVSLCSNK